MKAYKIFAVMMFSMLCAGAAARADSIDDIYLEKARDFVRENPVEDKVEQTRRQTLAFWRQIKT